MNIKEKASTLCDDLRVYWKKPPMGRYMSFKEIVSLAVGGLGIQFVVFCAQNMIISIGNTLISNTIGIAPKPLYIIYILSVILSFPLTALRGKIIDSSRSKKGRYRPFILSMGLPTAILAIAFVYMPYERMSMLAKCLTVLLFNIGLQFFYMFYYDVDQSIINVLSPNTYERSDVTSIKSVVNSMAPTLGNIILPLVARAITGENTLVDIRISIPRKKLFRQRRTRLKLNSWTHSVLLSATNIFGLFHSQAGSDSSKMRFRILWTGFTAIRTLAVPPSIRL